MKRIILLLTVLFIKLELISFTGYVKDLKNNPIKDVLVKCNNQYYFTDNKGRYYLEKVAKNDTLIFHKLGYQNKIIKGKDLKKIVRLSRKIIKLRKLKVIESYKNLSPDTEVIKKIKSWNNLSKLLSNEPGIYIKGNNIVGTKKSISIEGNLSKHTVVMLDGIVLNNTGEDFDISQIPIEIVDRVEIIKNNTSAISGSGGIGGIINIITKNNIKNGIGFKSGVCFGSFGKHKIIQKIDFSKNYTITLMLKKEIAKNNFSYIYPLSNEKPDSTRKNNKSKITDVNLNFIYKKLKLTFLYGNRYKELPGTIDKIPMFNKAHLWAYKLKTIASYNFKIKTIDILSKIYYFNDKIKYENTESTIPIYYSKTKTYDTKYGVQISEGIHLFKTKITFSQIYKRETFKFDDLFVPQNSIAQVYRDNFSVLNDIEKEFRLFDFIYLFRNNIRLDNTKLSDERSFKRYLSYRLLSKIGNSTLFVIPIDLTFVWGNSYSLPSFYDIYWKGDIQTQGNRDLKAEFSRGYELELKLGYQHTNFKISYSKNYIKNLIYWYKSVVAWKPGNVANAEISNFALSFSQNLKKLKLKMSYVRTKALDKTLLANGEHSIYYNKNLIYTPDYQLNLEIGYDFDFLKFEINYSEIGKRWVTRDNLWGYLDDYSILNGNLEIKSKIFNNYIIKLVLSVSNIFDNEFDKYQLMPDAGIGYEINFSIQKK